MKIVVFLGYSNSGKTSAMEVLIKALVKEGGKVGTIKGITERTFTIDKKGKDSWRHAYAGASVVATIAPRELAIINKIDTASVSLDDLLRIFRREGVDYVFVEGLYGRLSRQKRVIRILCARSKKDARKLLRLHPRPACIVSKNLAGETFSGIPLIRFPQNLSVALNLIG